MREYFCQQLNAHGVNDVMQRECIVPEPNFLEGKIAIEELKRYKSSGTDQIPAELIQAGGNTLHSDIHKILHCIWNREELPQQWKGSIPVPIYKNGDKTDCSNYRGISLLPTTYNILSKNPLSILGPYVHVV
jgi:hypothetical protein